MGSKDGASIVIVFVNQRVRTLFLDLVETWRVRLGKLSGQTDLRPKVLSAEMHIQAEKFTQLFLTKSTTTNYNKRRNHMAAWIDGIKGAIRDTKTLDVVTTTGTITLTAADMNNANWEAIGAKVSEKIKAAEVSVVAYTHSQWDCDTFMFVKASASDEEQKLVDSHAAVVDAAHATRREAVKMLVDAISATVK